jgi:dihydrodipicolinate synthase/N-acetylneuraminate lyase
MQERTMNTAEATTSVIASSVIAVPPLCRNPDLTLNRGENERLIRHLAGGGVSTLLFGGNAVLYHVPLREYAALLQMLEELAPPGALMIPSVGPAYGTMMDQAAILREFRFPTAMILPTRDMATSDGVATGVRRFVEAVGRPAVLYIKHDGFITTEGVQRLIADGLLSFIKYAIVRDNPSQDAYLRELVDVAGAERIVSGIGEQPALAHLRDFGLAGFTSGCVCVAPRLSMQVLGALKRRDYGEADRLRGIFRPLEDLRNRINPVRVLHAAVERAGIAVTGPILPLLSPAPEAELPVIEAAARELLATERGSPAARR